MHLPASKLQNRVFVTAYPPLRYVYSTPFDILCALRNARKLIRSMRSKDAYLKRKRDSQRHRIVEAEKMVGKKIEVRSTESVYNWIIDV